jgi:hypothetical protein
MVLFDTDCREKYKIWNMFRDGNRAGSTLIYSSWIHTRETKLNSYSVSINVRGYGSVSILVPAGYPLSDRYRYPPVHYNFSIQHQTIFLSHFKISIIPAASNNDFSTKHVMDKNWKMRIYDNILNSDGPHVRYPFGNGYEYYISILVKKLSANTLLYP